jgi:hypothetical protein
MTPTTMTTETRATMKKHLITLVLVVAAVHGGMIAAYYVLHVAERPARTQQTFVAIWVVLTLIIVSTIMKRIRKLRRRR